VAALPDLQRSFRDALVLGDTSSLDTALAGGTQPIRRVVTHQRHYAASLTKALLARFPATAWLVGSPVMNNAASEFVRAHPPSRPCLAEYGDAFPAFLADRVGAAGVAYVRQFAELEWHVSRISLSVDSPALTLHEFSTLDVMSLSEAGVVLQPGLHYCQADWAIDELMALHLSEAAPDHFPLGSCELWLEVRGARGELRMNRLTRGEFAFRAATAAGRSLVDAAVAALEVDKTFDPGQALLNLVGDGLVVRCDHVPTARTA
jgi:hypothetical protein